MVKLVWLQSSLTKDDHHAIQRYLCLAVHGWPVHEEVHKHVYLLFPHVWFRDHLLDLSQLKTHCVRIGWDLLGEELMHYVHEGNVGRVKKVILDIQSTVEWALQQVCPSLLCPSFILI